VRNTSVFAVSVAIALAACGLGCGAEPGERSDNDLVSVQSGLTAYDRALHWAPIHYQHIHQLGGTGMWGYADLFSRFDDDGDWVGTNNWDNLDGENMAYAYYTVAETATHWFFGYAFFHPRDWDDGLLQEHENDMEGVVEIVRKDGSLWGSFEAIMTVHHEIWATFRNPTTAAYLSQGAISPYLGNLAFEVSGDPTESHLRPMTWQHSQGHGFLGCENSNNCGLNGEDAVRTVPSGQATDSPLLPIQGIITRNYMLKDMAASDGLWGHRFDHNAQVSWNNYAGDDSGGCGFEYDESCPNNAAGTPWGASNYELLLFADPAKVANEFFAGWNNVNSSRTLSLDYTSNTLGTPHSWRSTWTPVAEGGQTDKAVAAAVLDGRMYVFAKAAGSGAQTLKVSSSAGADWTPFSTVPGGSSATDSQPAAVTCNNKMYMVVKSGTGEQALRWNVKTQTSNPGTGWGFWLPVPGATTNAGVALACRANKVYVLLKGGGDSRIYFAYIDTFTSTWSAWNEVPGNGFTYVTPAAAVDQSTQELDVVVVGTDANAKPYINRLCSTCGEFGWTGWSEHPGWTKTNSPVALAWDTGSGVPPGVYMFTRNSADNRLDADAWMNGGWRGPSIVRGHQRTADAPAAVRFDGVLYLFARGMEWQVPGWPLPPQRVADQRIWMTVGKGARMLSEGKPTAQISTWGGAVSSRAVDGRTDSPENNTYDGHIDGVFDHGYTTHTDLANNPWWEVDLGAPRIFERVQVWNRTDCCAERLREWSILTSNDHVNWTTIFTDSRPGGAGRLTVLNGYSDLYNGSNNAGRTSSSTAWVGRWVRIRINRPSEYLHLGEVQIFGN
jgi:hypothetical protein